MGSILKAINLAAFFAFWLSFLEPGIRTLEVLLGTTIRRSLPTSDESLLHVYLDWFLPALFLYVLFRSSQISRWMRVSPSTHTQLLVANALVVSVFFLAATDPSAGIVFAIFLGLPAVVFSLTGTLTLVFQAAEAKETSDPSWRPPFTATEIYSALFIALLVSLIFAGPVFLSPTSGVQLLLKNKELIAESCKTAGVEISRKISGPLLIDESMQRNFSQWVLPGMTRTDSKEIKRLLQDESIVSRVEWKEFDFRSKAWKYYAYQSGNPERSAIDAPTANYVISTNPIEDANLSNTRGMRGEAVTIREIATGRTMATFTYYSSMYPQVYCGQSIGKFDLLDFVSQAYEK